MFISKIERKCPNSFEGCVSKGWTKAFPRYCVLRANRQMMPRPCLGKCYSTEEPWAQHFREYRVYSLQTLDWMWLKSVRCLLQVCCSFCQCYIQSVLIDTFPEASFFCHNHDAGVTFGLPVYSMPSAHCIACNGSPSLHEALTLLHCAPKI